MAYIEKDALRRAMYHEAFETDTNMQRWDSGCWIRYKMFENVIEVAPLADVVPREQYTKLLKAAFAMHEWIFLNTDDEKTAYAECGLDDEMNALLGYGGSVMLTGGADHETD